MIIIKFRSNSKSKDEVREVSKRIINELRLPFVKSGSIVANDKILEGSSVNYLATIDLQVNDEILDIGSISGILNKLSSDYSWSFSSVHATNSIISIGGIEQEIPYISVNVEENGKWLNCSFYIIAKSANDAASRTGTLIKNAEMEFSLLDLSKYFKIDDCYIVSVKIPLVENTLDEIKAILFNFTTNWNFIGLKAYSLGCILDEKIEGMSVMFKKAKL